MRLSVLLAVCVAMLLSVIHGAGAESPASHQDSLLGFGPCAPVAERDALAVRLRMREQFSSANLRKVLRICATTNAGNPAAVVRLEPDDLDLGVLRWREIVCVTGTSASGWNCWEPLSMTALVLADKTLMGFNRSIDPDSVAPIAKFIRSYSLNEKVSVKDCGQGTRKLELSGADLHSALFVGRDIDTEANYVALATPRSTLHLSLRIDGSNKITLSCWGDVLGF